jgi:hypothetical protein
MWWQVSLWTRKQLLDARGDTAMKESANQSHGQVEVISARCTITKGCWKGACGDLPMAKFFAPFSIKH